MQKFSARDYLFMAKALKLAEKGKGKTSPNPMVGAVLVKNDKIIAETWHQKAGEAHAEVKALLQVSSARAKDSTLYVNLEPCCHYGKTPPCCDFLLKKGLKRVVVAMRDPNPLVNGQGMAFLRKAGLKVDCGIMTKQARRLNEAFICFIGGNYPFVILKTAATLDGKIASVSGDSRWITNKKSRKMVHELRSQVDAIITSAKTVIIDNPHLGARISHGKDPLRVILDSHLITRPTAKVYRDSNVLVATTCEVPPKKKTAFEKVKIQMIHFKGDHVPLKPLLRYLHSHGCASVLIETGATLSSAFLQQKLVNKLYYFIAPKILGDGLPAFQYFGIKNVKNALKLKNVQIKNFGNDIIIEGYLGRV